MADNNLTSSISALITQIKSEIPNANAENLKRLARSVRKLGHSGDNEIDTLINNRANALTATATTEELQTIAEAINQVDDTSNPTGATNANADVHVSDTAPASAVSGDLWWKTDDLNLYIYYEDTDGAQWIQANSTVVAGATAGDISELTDTTNLLFDGQYSSLTGAPSDISDLTDTTNLLSSSTAGSLGTLTKTFAQNEESEITLSENISPVPNVSVFKEVPQGGLTSKGNWDVNANATNYDFFDEKPISYSSTTLTPSATGDGTFTSSNPTLVGYDISGKSYVGNYETATPVSQVPNPPANAYTLADFVISPDGTKIIIVSANRMHEFTMSTAYDITSASWTQRYDYDAYNPSTWGGYGFFEFGDSGSKLYMADWANNKIDQFTLSTPYSLGNGGSDVSWSGEVSGMNNSGASKTQNGMYVKDSTTVFIMKDDVSGNQAVIEEWVMSTAWDITTLSYNNKTKSVTGQRGTDITFSSDGLTMFISDVFGSGTLKYFSLGTAWDISTINTTGTTVTLSSNPSSAPQAINFSKSGTKMYLAESTTIYEYDTGYSEVFSSTDVGKKVVGNSGSAVITSTAGAYTSVTPFADTSTISSWQLFGAQGKTDGSGIELSGYNTGYDISSLSLNNSYDISTISNTSGGGTFKSDGTVLYVHDNTADDILQYPLSTAWDLSTVGTSTGSVSHSTQDTNLRGPTWKPDGTIMYTSGFMNDRWYQWSLSTAWDVTTATNTTSKSFASVSAASGLPKFVPNGLKFIAGGNAGDINVWECSTAWAINTATLIATQNFSEYNSGLQYTFNNDGTKLLLAGRLTSTNVTGILRMYSLSTAYDPTTATYDNIEWDWVADGGQTSTPTIGEFSDDGNRLFLTGGGYVTEWSSVSTLHPYSQYSPALTNSTGQINSTSWTDIDSMVADETKNDGDVFYAVSTDNRTSWGVIKDGDGVRKIARNNSGTWQYNNAPGTTVSIGYDLANGSGATLSSHLSQNEGYQYMHLKPDGTKVWVGGQTSDTIFEYDIGTAFDLSTVSYGRSKSFTASTQSRGFFFKPDGTRAYISDYTGTLRQLNMNTAWDISTAQTAYDSYNMSTTTSGIFFKSDGTKFYNIDGSTGRELKQFSMSTPWDITTATVDHTISLPSDQGVSNQGTALSGNDIWFSSDGTYFFLPHGNTGNPVSANSHIDILKGVAKFSLSTAWDISSTITYLENIKQVDQNGAHLNWTPSAVNFNSDGSKMYTIVSENSSTSPAQRIMEFSTGGTTTSYNTNQTWVDGTNNNEHATLQEALGAQSFNRMDKAQLQAVTDPNHYVLGDTLDLMIAPYATSGTSPLSDGVTIGYQADALVRQAINGTDYEAEFPALNKVKIKSLAAQNLKIRIV